LLRLKSKELIVIASSVLMRCQFCIEVCSQRVISERATKKEIAEAIAVAMSIVGDPQLGWTNIYGENVYDLVS
jgi:AhpD family alkylhydroperoxidase